MLHTFRRAEGPEQPLPMAKPSERGFSRVQSPGGAVQGKLCRPFRGLVDERYLNRGLSASCIGFTDPSGLNRATSKRACE